MAEKKTTTKAVAPVEPLSLLDEIAAFEDVEELLLPVPEWGGVEILFRGLTLASLETLATIDVEAATAGDIVEAAKMIAATACDPKTKLPIFAGERGVKVLQTKNFEVVMRLLNEGTLVVLGQDEADTAGKG